MATKNLDLAQVGFDFGNVPVAPTPTPPRADDPDDPPDPRFALALRLARMIAAGERFNGQRLMDEAAAVFGSTLAAGRWSSKEAYDAMEVAVNRHLLDTETAHWTALAAEGAAAKARALTQFVQRLPTQTRRDEETDEYQQFSTPPALAFVANWVAHVRPEDTLLEPSAGTADLAIWSRIAGAQVILNELSPRRLALLAQLLPDARRFAENAEHLDNVLPPDVLPTVIVMNPPFSATAGRIPGERKTTNGARHIEQALRRLADNGRLVAIVGDGMAPERPTFYAWWREIERHYSVRANVGIAGREYAKYGTTFDHRLLVIDKCGPTQATVVTGRVASVAELPPLLENIRNARPRLPTAPPQPTSRPDPAEIRHPVQSGDGISQPGADSGRAGTRSAGNEDDPGAAPADRPPVPPPGPGDGLADASGTGDRPGDDVRDRASALLGGSRSDAPGGDRGLPERSDADALPVIVETVTAATLAAFSEAIFSQYVPQRLHIPGSQPHPGKLVQSAAMAAVSPPAPTYAPRLPSRVITDGLLSLAQLEAVVYAGQAHSEVLPNGARKGFFIGDGTGVGKGREIAGVILDNLMHGRTKAVWISFNEGLIADARRDFAAIGGNPDWIFFQGKTPASGAIPRQSGILFTTYSTLRGGQKKLANDQGQAPGKTRLRQMVEWLGQDFEGVVAFDEAHSMGNAIGIKGPRGTSKPARQALTGIQLQHELPQARVLYVSATGATEVSNLTYAERLGLWGEGTAFADAKTLIHQVAAGGVTAMELVSRDMKAMGGYLARSLSFEGVTYERLEHTLTDFQREVYDELAAAWQVVLQNVNTALEITQAGHDPAAKNTAMSQFWGTHQRFFNQVITALQTPSVIDHLRGHLEAGHAAVIQLVNTHEATQERLVAEAMADGSALEELDFTPRQMLMEYVRHGFPIAAFEEAADENGHKVFTPVTDAEGNPVFDRQAIALRDALLDTLQAIRVPENPLDSIIQAFGAEVVAEVTGRRRRFVQHRDENGTLRVVEEMRGSSAARADAERFQNDQKRILLFSAAGGTGYSFHADLTAANQRKRIHYILQPGWAAAAAVQGFGRTHRTNQATEPHYVLPTTNLQAQKRFISAIARRLDQLGALTQGQRQATSQGVFSAADNLESEYAASALKTLFLDLYHQRTSLSFREVTSQMGLNLLDKDGTLVESKIPAIPQFLNRLLSLKTALQNAVFEEFEHRLVEAVEVAKQHDTYDAGLQTLRALSIQKTRDEVVYEKNDAQTRYVELAVTQAVPYLQWSDITALIQARRPTGSVSGWLVSEEDRTQGEVFFLLDLGHRVNAEGRDIHRGILYNIRKGEHRYIDHADVISRDSRPVSAAEAEALWNAQLAAAPKTVTIQERLLVGVILPIWDRVEGSAKIYRLQTDDGESLLGRRLSAKAAAQTLRNLGLHSEVSSRPPSEWYAAIRDGQKAVLSNGWEITVARVSDENRIEIKGRGPFTDAEKKILQDQGAFIERINWAERVFIPTGDDGLAVFERITASKPVVELFQPRAGMTPATDRRGGPAAYDVPTPQATNPLPPRDDQALNPPRASTAHAALPPRETTPLPSQPMNRSRSETPYRQSVAEKLIEQLKAGTAPWQRPWEPGHSFLPMNPTTGKRYKGINAIHLMAQEYPDARWMTYHQAAAVGAQVRQGEEGTRIQYWKFTEQQDLLTDNGQPVLDARGHPIQITVRLERPRVFFATVFNAAQIDGLPPIQSQAPAWEASARAEAILQASGATLRHGSHSAFYHLATDCIHLPDQGQFATADRYYATALHELGHWTGHASRLDRDLSHPFGSEGYAQEELRAEIASMLMGDTLGIGHDPAQHAAYVGSWIKALSEDPLHIFRAAAEAEKIHAYVLAFEQKQVQEQGQQPATDPRQPHEMTLAEFANQAKVEELTNHGRRWNVTLGDYAAFSDADSPPAALADVHRAAVHNALYLNTPEAAGIGHPPTLPPPAVRAEYPDLVAQYPQATEQEANMQLSEQQEAEPRPDVTEAWTLGHLERGTLARALDGANQDQIEQVSTLLDAMQPLNTENEFWTRHALPQDVEALQGKLRQAGAFLERRRLDAAVAEARKAGDDESMDQAARAALGFTLPHDWNGNVQVQGNVIVPVMMDGIPVMMDGKEFVEPAAALGVEPTFWGVYAQHHQERHGAAGERKMLYTPDYEGVVLCWTPECAGEEVARFFDQTADMAEVEALNEAARDKGGHVQWFVGGRVLTGSCYEQGLVESKMYDEDGLHTWLADFKTQEQAEELAERLRLIDAHSEKSEHEKAAKLARVQEERVRRDPNSTDEDLSAAKEARKSAEATAMRAESEAQRRNAEKEREERDRQQAAQQQKAERTYINVPYGEKDEAKAFGARWDRRQQSWYVPPGVDPAPFAKWAPGAAKAATEGRQEEQQQQGAAKTAQQRVYLAVPYGQHRFAKEAGALWDKAAKSWYAGPKADWTRLERWKPENVPGQQGPAMSPREEFAEALRALGCLVAGEHPIMDGTTHRIKTEGDRLGEQAGFYVGHLDGHPAGYIKNNRTGLEMKWKAKGYTLDPEEKAKLQAEAATQRAERAAEQDRLHEAAAQRVSRQTETLVPVAQPTPYMQAKGIAAHAGLLTDQDGQKTYLPAFDVNGKQWTMQYIQEDGTKRFAKDSRKDGCFHPVGGMDAVAAAPALVIAEGYATAATLAEALGQATVAAFDAGNLPAVARALQEKFPDKPVIIAGDDDRHQVITQGANPGRTKAEEAAQAVGGTAIFPIFAPGENAYPAHLPPITPQTYREHERALHRLEAARKEPEKVPLTEQETADLQRALLSPKQRAGLAGMKAHTDFNDLATRSELGRDGVERQAKAAVSQALQAQEQRQAQKQKLDHRRPIGQNLYRIPGLGGHHQAGPVGRGGAERERQHAARSPAGRGR